MMYFWMFLLNCSQPDPCADMCSASAQVYGACLESWGASWEAAGYSDARDYFHSCETWAWELRLLEKQAKRDGEVPQTGRVDKVCRTRAEELRNSETQCETWESIDWESLPW